jgi:hypothetical protein
MSNTFTCSYANKATRAKYDRIVEIVRANPGISSAAIAKAYAPNATFDTHHRMQGTLLQVCISGRIECINNCYFISKLPAANCFVLSSLVQIQN